MIDAGHKPRPYASAKHPGADTICTKCRRPAKTIMVPNGIGHVTVVHVWWTVGKYDQLYASGTACRRIDESQPDVIAPEAPTTFKRQTIGAGPRVKNNLYRSRRNGTNGHRVHYISREDDESATDDAS